MIIAVDFDGTISLGDLNEMLPNHALITKLIKARSMGHKLILWTCRGEEWLNEAIAFCQDYNLVFDAVNENIKGYDYIKISCKAVADLYVDDKSPGSIEYFMRMIG